MFFLFFIITGVIIFSLATPQILKYIIDDYFSVGKKNLIFPAFLYFGSIVLLGIFNFAKEGTFFKNNKRSSKLFNNNSAIDSPAIDRQATSREKIKVILVCANTTVCDVAFRYSNL